MPSIEEASGKAINMITSVDHQLKTKNDNDWKSASDTSTAVD